MSVTGRPRATGPPTTEKKSPETACVQTGSASAVCEPLTVIRRFLTPAAVNEPEND